MPEDLNDLVGKLTLEEKVSLLTGQDFWSTLAIPEIGLRSIVVSDGPSGVRGPLWDERDPSLSLPSATSISSSWDTDLVTRVGNVMASEARRKGVDVILGPTINLHRSPLGGRHFECFSEDPYLSGKIAASFVTGVQERGVGATLKHYVANDSENDRFTVNAVLSEQNLRENYLKPFEIALRESQAWLVMSAYNSVNGPTMSENPLLDEPLKGEWGFDGLVISDWTAVRTTVAAGNASTDLAMPGPFGPWGDALVAAVRSGEVSEAKVDEKVGRLMLLAQRIGALGVENTKAVLPDDEVIAFARKASAAGTVMVKNHDATLPLSSSTKIAISGGHAKYGREQGGGSATVMPAQVISPLQGIIERFGSDNVSYQMGVPADTRITPFNKLNSHNPISHTPGVKAQIFGADDAIVFEEDRLGSHLVWMAQPWARSAHYLKVTLDFTPEVTGEYQIGIAYVGKASVFADGELLKEMDIGTDSTDVGAAILNPPQDAVPLQVVAGKPVRLEFKFLPGLSLQVDVLAAVAGFIEPIGDLVTERKLAAQKAEQADVAVVFVGTTPAIESEGYDRSDLRLPAGQDELVAAVARAAKKTIVVVNAGAPVEMPWHNDVDAILLSWFPGQEMGSAVADILSGLVEPGGRLPTSWPEQLSDSPVINTDPINGELEYSEGSYFGYRGYFRNSKRPLFPFGHGLGYTSFESTLISAVRESNDSQVITVKVSCKNIGTRTGAHVIQIYGRPVNTGLEDRKLFAFKKVELAAGDWKEFSLDIPLERFRQWQQGWVINSHIWAISLCENAFDDGVSINVAL